MSELINSRDNHAAIRWKLLTGASALVLTACISSANIAKAEDSDRPQVWIELGGQLSRLSDAQETFAPLLAARPSIFAPSQNLEKPPLYSLDESGQISFQPEGSDWIFSASIKYGRALKDRHRHQQTYPSSLVFDKYPTNPTHDLFGTARPRAARFADTSARSSERHIILDFQAGKDVGLGLFGKNSSSTVSLGVRFAQFKSNSNITLKSDPDWHFQPKYACYYGSCIQFMIQPYHSNLAALSAERSFRGVGPSLSWSASTPFAGNPQDGELSFDWGLNVAALFGRQKTRTHHHTTVRYNDGGYGFNGKYGTLVTQTHIAPPPQTRSRNVTVPNIGGFAGLSFRYVDAKISLGYRADFFFNAIDGGIDSRKSENRGFNGPYASISIGLGD